MHTFNEATATFQLLGVRYLDFLAMLHNHLVPRSYLEIGCETGASLTVVNCDTIAVDPRFQLHPGASGNRRRTFFFQMPSDEFFASESPRNLFGRPVDMAFLDGMHRFEFLFRDFIATEAACHPRSLILMHDCVPLNSRMALRVFQPGDAAEGETGLYWTGDVWKLLPILKEYRPDLRVHVLDCPPTGLVAITNLDPTSRVLSDRYYEIVDKYAPTPMDQNHVQSFWDALQLTETRPLCEQPDRLTEVFSLY